MIGMRVYETTKLTFGNLGIIFLDNQDNIQRAGNLGS